MALMRWNKTLPGHCHFAVRMTESGNLQWYVRIKDEHYMKTLVWKGALSAMKAVIQEAAYNINPIPWVRYPNPFK